MSIPDVSVIIPLYNRSHLIGFTLDSLAPELHPGVNLEVIVVDDGSSDGGPELVIKKWPGVKLLNQSNLGAPSARNRGIEVASSKLVFLLDSDDLVEEGFFLSRMQRLKEDSNADGVYGPWDHFQSDAEFSELTVVPRHTPYPIESGPSVRSHLLRLLGGWYGIFSSALWKVDALRRVDGYDPDLRVNQDVDLLFKILVSGNGIVGCASPRLLFRDHQGQRQGRVAGSRSKVEQILLLRYRFILTLQESPFWDELARHALGRFCFNQSVTYRADEPDISQRFLDLSREIYPELRLKGRWPLRLLSSLIGAERATIVREKVRSTITL